MDDAGAAHERRATSRQVCLHPERVRIELMLAGQASFRTGGALVAGRLLRCLDPMARITGQLATSPLVQVNNTTTVFTHDPGSARFEAQLIRVLSRFPNARAAVIAEFQKFDRSTGAGPVTIDRPAALPGRDKQAGAGRPGASVRLHGRRGPRACTQAVVERAMCPGIIGRPSFAWA
jgi:hypothetical protein